MIDRSERHFAIRPHPRSTSCISSLHLDAQAAPSDLSPPSTTSASATPSILRHCRASAMDWSDLVELAAIRSDDRSANVNHQALSNLRTPRRSAR